MCQKLHAIANKKKILRVKKSYMSAWLWDINIISMYLLLFQTKRSFVSYNNEIQRKLIALNNKGTWITQFFWPCMQKNCIYVSDYPASEHMKFVCTVNIYASGSVRSWCLLHRRNDSSTSLSTWELAHSRNVFINWVSFSI